MRYPLIMALLAAVFGPNYIDCMNINLTPDIREKPVLAEANGLADLMALPSDFVQTDRSLSKCVTSFGTMFDRIEPLSSGYYGAVFLAYTHDDKIYALKASRISDRSLQAQVFDTMAGVQPLDETKIGYSLMEEVSKKHKSGAFVNTFDWFQCNYRVILQVFCRDRGSHKCPKLKKMPEGIIDTQFMLMKFVESEDLLAVFSKFHDKPLGPSFTNFIRSITFQTFHALKQAADAIGFYHFDLNFHNTRLKYDKSAHDVIAHGLGDLSDFAFHDDEMKAKWKVPVTDSDGLVMKIIDFGLARISLPNGQLLGAELAKRFPDDRQSAQISMRQFILNLLLSMDRKMIKRWRKEDSRGYAEFEEIAFKAIGYENTDKLLGKLALVRPPRDMNGKIKLHKLGHLSFIRNLGHDNTEKYIELVGTYSANAHNFMDYSRRHVEKFLSEQLKQPNAHHTDFDFSDILNMPFYQSYRAPDLD